MTKLSYDDGSVWSTVVLNGGIWLEVRRGDLTGKALRASNPRGKLRRWASREAWLAAVCVGPVQEWAILGTYRRRWTDIKSLTELMTDLRYLQGMYNASQSVGARMYWAECITEIGGAGFQWSDVPSWMRKPYILAHPSIALEMVMLCDRLHNIWRRQKRYSGWYYYCYQAAGHNLRMVGFCAGPRVVAWRESFGQGPTGPVTLADLPELDLFGSMDALSAVDEELAAARAAVTALEERRQAIVAGTA